MMENHIKHLRIKNYKSIYDVNLSCSKINLFIGKPNVGKSNILEAIKLLGPDPLAREENKFYSGLIYYENIRNLFYDNKHFADIEISTNNVSKQKSSESLAKISYDSLQDRYFYDSNSAYSNMSKNSEYNDKIKQMKADLSEDEFQNQYRNLKNNTLDKDKDEFVKTAWISRVGMFHNQRYFGSHEAELKPIRAYSYKKSFEFKNQFAEYLNPPFGDNLISVFQSYPEITEFLEPFFKYYGYDLAPDLETHELKIQKKLKGAIYSFPFTLVADTLQRYAFYIASIFSNSNSIVIYEEPESHLFVTYIRDLANLILNDESNQFFISSHNPYLLQTLIESNEDIKLFLVGFEDYKTVVKEVSDSKIEEIIHFKDDILLDIDTLY